MLMKTFITWKSKNTAMTGTQTMQYIDESGDDLEMWGDEEVVDILQSVFGIDSDTEEL